MLFFVKLKLFFSKIEFKQIFLIFLIFINFLSFLFFSFFDLFKEHAIIIFANITKERDPLTFFRFVFYFLGFCSAVLPVFWLVCIIIYCFFFSLECFFLFIEILFLQLIFPLLKDKKYFHYIKYFYFNICLKIKGFFFVFLIQEVPAFFINQKDYYISWFFFYKIANIVFIKVDYNLYLIVLWIEDFIRWFFRRTKFYFKKARQLLRFCIYLFGFFKSKYHLLGFHEFKNQFRIISLIYYHTYIKIKCLRLKYYLKHFILRLKGRFYIIIYYYIRIFFFFFFGIIKFFLVIFIIVLYIYMLYYGIFLWDLESCESIGGVFF